MSSLLHKRRRAGQRLPHLRSFRPRLLTSSVPRSPGIATRGCRREHSVLLGGPGQLPEGTEGKGGNRAHFLPEELELVHTQGFICWLSVHGASGTTKSVSVPCAVTSGGEGGAERTCLGFPQNPKLAQVHEQEPRNFPGVILPAKPQGARRSRNLSWSPSNSPTWGHSQK